MNTSQSSEDQDGPVVHADGLVVGDRPIFRVANGHAAAICDPDDPDGPEWQDSGTPAVRCALYFPGHHVHWIQAGKGLRTPATPYTLTDVDGQWATFRSASGTEHRWRFHDTTALSALLLLDGPSTVYLHGHNLLRAGRSLLYVCSEESSWTDCRS